MFDWIKKRLTKTQEKEQPQVTEERDYLSEWNREHPEEFMDLRLRTIEDEMSERRHAFTVDEAAWVDDKVVPKTGDSPGGGDCPKAPLFVNFQLVRSVQLTRSVSLPGLSTIAGDHPVHGIRNHWRYKRRRCDMAADPLFLRDIHFVHRENRKNCSAVVRC